MILSGLTILTVLLAGLNVWIARRTLQSQKASQAISEATQDVLTDTKDLQDRVFSNMNEALQQIKELQEIINTRERRTKQERARTAVQTLLTALRNQVTALDGQWIPSPSGLLLKDDPLGPIRAYHSELAWIPPCDWRNTCQEIFRRRHLRCLETVGGRGIRRGS